MPYRKVVFWAHLAVGIGVGALIFSMSVTGILLAFEPQIVDWSERHIRFVDRPAPDSRRASLDVLAANARGKFPGATSTDLRLWSHPAAAVAVNLGRETGNVYVNPYTGVVLGRSSKAYFFLQWVEEWHRWLGSKKIWKPIIDAANLVFLFMLISGLYLWWPRRWTRRALKTIAVPNLKLKGLARDWNWHNAFGFWTAPLLLVITLTGAVIGYRWASDLVYVLSGNTPPPKPREERSGMARAQLPAASLDSMLSQAESKVSNWFSIYLRLPRKPGTPVVAYIQEPGFWRRSSRSQLTLNPASAEVIKWEPYSGYDLGRKLRSWVVPIHTGSAGGVPGQIIAALAAFITALLVWTGVSMAWRRFCKSGINTRI